MLTQVAASANMEAVGDSILSLLLIDVDSDGPVREATVDGQFIIA